MWFTSNLAPDFVFGRISGPAAGLTRGSASPLSRGWEAGRMQWVAVCLLS